MVQTDKVLKFDKIKEKSEFRIVRVRAAAI